VIGAYRSIGTAFMGFGPGFLGARLMPPGAASRAVALPAGLSLLAQSAAPLDVFRFKIPMFLPILFVLATLDGG
jgi:hypothetical protein